MADDYSKSALTYKGTDWKDMQSGGTPINAKNLNNIEGGIGNLTTRSNDQDTQLSDVTSRTKALEGKTEELESAWDSVTYNDHLDTVASIAAGATEGVTFTVAGKTVLGVIGVSFSGASNNHCCINSFGAVDGTVTVRFKNTATFALSNIQVRTRVLVK